MRRNRAVSTTLSYVLTLAIATLLITGLIIAGGGYIDTQREQVIRDELTVVGQQVAADVERVDRLARAGDGASTVSLNKTVSNSVTGAKYELRLNPDDSTLVLTSSSPEITVRVGITNQTALGESTARGGAIQIWYNDTGSRSRLEVRNV